MIIWPLRLAPPSTGYICSTTVTITIFATVTTAATALTIAKLRL